MLGWLAVNFLAMGIVLRAATAGDSDGVVRVIRSVYDEYGFTWEPEGYHADLYDLDAHYHSLGHLFFVTEIDERIVGTAALETFDVVPGPLGAPATYQGKTRIAGTDCSLERLYVDPGARRRGLGSMLFEKVLAEAKAQDMAALEIWSDKRFGDAHRLYQRFGARVVTDRICDDPDESPEWGLILTLR